MVYYRPSMTITVEIKQDVGIMLAKSEGSGLVPFLFPGESPVVLPAAQEHYFLTRVPLIETESEGALVSVEGARPAIPFVEAVGKNLESYIIKSLPGGLGGEVNGVIGPLGVPEDDGGVIFTAS